MKIVIFFVLLYNCFAQYASGTLNKFEFGEVFYRKASMGHGHAAIFSGLFAYNNNTYSLSLYETEGYALGDEYVKTDNLIFNGVNTSIGYSSLINKFERDGYGYLGMLGFSGLTPLQKNYAVDIARTIFENRGDIGYTWTDMIDADGVQWLNDWDGKISDIDEVRCDAYVEYPYELAGGQVSGWMNI